MNIGLRINKGVLAGVLMGIGLILIGIYFGYGIGFRQGAEAVNCSNTCWRLMINATI